MYDYTPLPACPTEDSTNCYWDAVTNGNSTGQSFANIDGTIHPISVPDNYYILEAVAYTDGTPGIAFQEMAPPAPAYDLTAPALLVVATLVTAVIAVVVSFRKRA